MKVKDLIKKLEKLDGEKEIGLYDYDDRGNTHIDFDLSIDTYNGVYVIE